MIWKGGFPIKSDFSIELSSERFDSLDGFHRVEGEV